MIRASIHRPFSSTTLIASESGVMADHVADTAASTATDDTAAFHAWVASGVSTGKKLVWIGGMRLTPTLGPTLIPSTTESFVLEGISPRQSYIMLDGAFPDYFMRIIDRTGNWSVTSSMYDDDGVFPPPPGTLKWLTLRNFALLGAVTNLDGTGDTQRGIAFVGVNDSVEIVEVLVAGINGTGVYMGLSDSTVRAGGAMFREATVTGLKIERCGSASEAAWILSAGGDSGYTGANETHFVDCASNLSAGDAMHIVCETNGSSASMKFTRLKLHGTSDAIADVNIVDIYATGDATPTDFWIEPTVPAGKTLCKTLSNITNVLQDGQRIFMQEIRTEGTIAAALNDKVYVVDRTGMTNPLRRNYFYVAEDTTGLAYSGGGTLLPAFNSITPGNPTVISSTNHRHKDTELVNIGAVVGTMAASLNDLEFNITKIDDDTYSVPVDTSALLYTSGGWGSHYVRPKPHTANGLRITGSAVRLEFDGLLILNCANDASSYALWLERSSVTNQCPSNIYITGSIAGTWRNAIRIDGGSDIYIYLSQCAGDPDKIVQDLIVGAYVTGPIHIESQKLTRIDIHPRALRWLSGLKMYAAATTTDATLTNLAVMQMEDGERLQVQVTVQAREVGGALGSASYTLMGTFRMEGGTATQVGTTTVLHSAESDAAWDCVMNASGANVRFRITGAAATTIDWEITDLKVLAVDLA